MRVENDAPIRYPLYLRGPRKMAASSHLHPVQDRLLQRAEKEALLGQRGCVIWMTGLSGSGKSTIAIAVERDLHQRGRFVVVLDGDNVRTGINNNLGFSDADRTENIRRIAEVAKLFVQQGVIVLCSFVSPTVAIREQAKTIIGAADFLEVFIDTPLEVCEQRDVKGLYAKARTGEVKDFTGISAPFEAPSSPALRIATAGQSEEASAQELLNFILPRVSRP
jgi:adenylylsulfate kinase